MAKIAFSVRPWELGPLRGLAPCRCSENPYKDCTFYVNAKTFSTYIVGSGPKVKHVDIICNCCKKSVSKDVGSMEIYQNDLSF